MVDRGIDRGCADLRGGSRAAWFRERTHRRALDEAREALAQGRVGLARERLTRLTEQHPDDTRAWLMLGECEVRRGRRPDGLIDPGGREAALACWARVPLSSADYSLAVLCRLRI